ncbi:hypothetical protein GGR95_001184 [Sulfitobacter undariae]|uniref:Uncharacterized protein n=1 Tax=Sulfitobacter undariae TaxID=1563671 RepID=A0A7W6E869_9RHOB|nr:hypothetical protein [Sulfitobacter undariae]MBB3993553.1 hypothetical protein [Sulfitobacter undariae]
MSKHNKSFDLSISDIALIESALNVVKRDLSLGREGARALLPNGGAGDPVRDIDELLGRLHNQKVFFRPSKTPYIGG